MDDDKKTNSPTIHIDIKTTRSFVVILYDFVAVVVYIFITNFNILFVINTGLY